MTDLDPIKEHITGLLNRGVSQEEFRAYVTSLDLGPSEERELKAWVRERRGRSGKGRPGQENRGEEF